MMDDKFNQLLALVGTPVEKEDPSNPDQCMDLAFAWVDILGIDRATIRHQFAYQVYTQPFDITVAKFCLIPNTPNGIPQKGDLVVFDHNIAGVTGDAGHICIATGEGDVNSFKSLDQNWNGVLHVTQEQHVYTGVLGWLRANTDQQALIDQLRQDRDKNHNLWIADEATIKSLNQTINDKNNSITTLNEQIKTSQATIGEKDMQIQTLQLQADKVIPLTKERDQAVDDRDACLRAEDDQQAKIKELQASSYFTASAGTLFWELFDRVFKGKKVI